MEGGRLRVRDFSRGGLPPQTKKGSLHEEGALRFRELIFLDSVIVVGIRILNNPTVVELRLQDDIENLFKLPISQA